MAFSVSGAAVPETAQAMTKWEKQMVEGQHLLLGSNPEQIGDDLDRIDRGAVNVGLASLPEPAVADRDVEPLQETFQRRGSAIHRRGLHDLRREPSPTRRYEFGFAHEDRSPTAASPPDGFDSRRPAARSASAAGEPARRSPRPIRVVRAG
jgi:hypothetical protein